LIGGTTFSAEYAELFGETSLASKLFPLYPELFLTFILTALLTYIAYLLHQNVDKKSIALASLEVVQHTLTALLVIYIVQLVTTHLPAIALNGYFVVSLYTTVAKLLLVSSALLVIGNSYTYVEEHPHHHLEYATVFLLAILLMVLLVSSNHILSAFLSLVGFSLNLYVLIMFDAASAAAREAGIKYYYLSTFSSGLLLYGLFLLYTLTGQGQFELINLALAANPQLLSESSAQLKFAVIFVLVGLFFKLSAFPAHFWAAEVYDGSPSPITTFFMVPVKVAVLGFTLQFLIVALAPGLVY
jgi:NADH-quinone oxidoreductase subunit N